MRISDWSSDVCSSDLLRDGGRIALALRKPFVEGPPGGEVAVHRIMRRGLVGEKVRMDAAPDHLGQDLGGVAEQAHRRSEERRVGKECGSTCRSRLSPDHEKKNTSYTRTILL